MGQRETVFTCLFAGGLAGGFFFFPSVFWNREYFKLELDKISFFKAFFHGK